MIAVRSRLFDMQRLTTQPDNALTEALTGLLRFFDGRGNVRGQRDGLARVARLWSGRAACLVRTPPAVGSFWHCVSEVRPRLFLCLLFSRKRPNVIAFKIQSICRCAACAIPKTVFTFFDVQVMFAFCAVIDVDSFHRVCPFSNVYV
jgi:hypothetical protein